MKNIGKKILLILLVISIIISSSACRNDTPHPEEEILSFTLGSDPLTLDPQIADDYSSYMLIANLFEGLVRLDSNGNPKSGIAESWDISGDGLTYVFHLFENTKWSSGTPVTADDFVFGITRALTPETKSEDATDLFLIKNASAYYNGELSADMLGVSALDEHTLQINLEYESDSLLLILAEPVAMPCNREFFNSTKGKYGKNAEQTITNGPFRIRESYGWDHDNYIYIRRSENYNAANSAVPLGVNFTFGQQPSDPIAAIKNGDVDICEIYGNQLKHAEENNFNVATTTNTLWGLCCNSDIPALKNDGMRRALFSAVDRDSLLKYAPKSYVKTSQLIADDVLFAGYNYREQAGSFTLETADSPTALYNESAEELHDNNIELKSSYTILYLDDDTSSELVTSIIERWNEISGCYFNKQPLSRDELEENIRSGSYEIAIAPLNTLLDSPMEFLSRFVTDASENYINLNEPSYNKFIETAISENGSDSVESLKSAESFLVSKGYLYPLYYENRYFAAADNVTGAVFSKTGQSIDFTQVTKISED